MTLLPPATATAEQGTIHSNGVEIHFVDEGDGEAVVFLHGFDFTFVSIEGADQLMAPLSPDFASAVSNLLGN